MEKITLPLLFLFLFSNCQPAEKTDPAKLKAEIQSLETQLLESGGDVTKNKDAAMQLVEKTSLYAKQFPQDTLTPLLLFKAGDVAKGARDFGKAVQLWGEVWRNYPSHPKASLALFMQGFTFDSELRDSVMAKKYYNEFLQKFPQDPLAGQVKQLLAVVGKNPEEMVKEFEKANQ